MSTTATALTTTGTYALDPAHSRVGFVARHARVTKVRGSFNEFRGSGFFDSEEPTDSYLEIEIDAASIDTRNSDRDAHLRGDDFFGVAAYPEIRFVSTSVRETDDGKYRVVGDLTIKDVTKPVTVDFVYTGTALDPYGNQRIGFEGNAVVNRKDWGLTWNALLETGGLLVSENVTLEFDVSAIKQA
jgi:polyisoprenoid-binding protein YceI